MVVATALMLGLTQACSEYSTGSGGNGGHGNNISVSNNSFHPTPDTVTAADTVVFTWVNASNSHNVTWLTGPGTLPTNSSTMTTGAYKAKLAAGTYTFHCTIHSGMNGTIVAQ
ncbi:MAG TPA: hypothetical protein VEL50_05250 [Gemmatimonadales bacterium]|nr:hypothetical protein [Gemmatimonadales bacterium]